MADMIQATRKESGTLAYEWCFDETVQSAISTSAIPIWRQSVRTWILTPHRGYRHADNIIAGRSLTGHAIAL